MAKAKSRRCPCQGQTLDRVVQPVILALLAREPRSGYRVLRELAATPLFQDSPPDRTGIYRHLKDMERRGLLRGTWKLSAAGPASRTFRLTRAGRACLESWEGTLTAYLTELTRVRRLVRGAARARK